MKKTAKTFMTFLTAMTMTMGAMSVTAYAEETDGEYINGAEDIRGDANRNGELEIRDAAMIAKAIKCDTIDSLPPCADWDGNGVINVRDVSGIAKYLYEQATKSTGDINTLIKGDADLSGMVDLADLTAVAKYNLNNELYPLENETAFANADMNDDGEVNGVDTSALIENQLGK